ncbi:pilus assembly protein [Rhizobium lusitanum]|uniref:Pilus assembly protein n=1 Tax=Rhizobium lusitanum TaxID=293958 RepID=A0A6L9UEB3_9HYPH|nr:TadE/TadG family type IV pilus assembly protein [Rhizobium lusitanum]NEI73689.1 pilus assembly protein [Rhizobium lusitanum]
MNRVSHFNRAKEGAAAVEFALIAPLFFLLLLTLVAFAIYLTAAHSLQQLTADAARTAIAGLSADERSQMVQDFVTRSTINDAFINKSRLTVTVATDPANVNQFTVSAAYDASDLPIWNLYTFAMPDQTIRRYSTIRLGGL